MEKRYNIVSVPVMSLGLATDKFGRILLSADIVKLYELEPQSRVELGYVPELSAITVRRATNDADPTAANVDKRGYISARQFFRKTRIEKAARKYAFEAEQDGWLIFVKEPIPSP